MFTKIKEWKLYLEGKNGPTAGEEKKDLMRIYDIVDKANGDKAKEKQLAQLMANKITDISKAKRRADVADAEGHSHLASIFTKRYRELKRASRKNEDIDNGTSVKKITAADINPKDDNASTHEVPLAVKLHGKKSAKNESLERVYAITRDSNHKLAGHTFDNIDKFNEWAKDAAERNEIYGPYTDQSEYNKELSSSKPQKIDHNF